MADARVARLAGELDARGLELGPRGGHVRPRTATPDEGTNSIPTDSGIHIASVTLDVSYSGRRPRRSSTHPSSSP